MRTLERPLRGNCASAPIDEGAHAIGIVGVPGDQHVDIVRHTDRPRSNIQCAVPDKANPLLTISGPFA